MTKKNTPSQDTQRKSHVINDNAVGNARIQQYKKSVIQRAEKEITRLEKEIQVLKDTNQGT